MARRSKESALKLTRPGWRCCLAGLVLLTAGALTQVAEAVLIGCALLTGLALALALLASGDPLDVRRTLRPSKLEIGERAEVSLEVRHANHRLRLPSTLQDSLNGSPLQALVFLPPRRNGSASVEFSLLADRRGRHRIGPAVLITREPLGLAYRERSCVDTNELIVLARTIELADLRSLAGDHETSGSSDSRILITAREEFSTVREFTPGDDIRRVHWPTTARTGTPMVRHFEQSYQSQVTLLADLGAARHTVDSFERTISAMASVVRGCAHHNEQVRILTTGWQHSAYVRDLNGLSQLEEHIACLEPDRSESAQLIALLDIVQERNENINLAVLGALPIGQEDQVTQRILAGSGAHVLACHRGSASLRLGLGRTIDLTRDSRLGVPGSLGAAQLGDEIPAPHQDTSERAFDSLPRESGLESGTRRSRGGAR